MSKGIGRVDGEGTGRFGKEEKNITLSQDQCLNLRHWS